MRTERNESNNRGRPMATRRAGVVVVAAAAAASPASAQTITDIGPGAAVGISADGTAVVGTTTNTLVNDQRSFRWTRAGGMVSLGLPPGGTGWSAVVSVNGDGSVIV